METLNIDWLFIILIVFSWFYYVLMYPLKYLFMCCKKNEKFEYDLTTYYVSVIVPCRNEEKVIAGTLKNIEKLGFNEKTNYHNMEIIVVNDGSKDKTQEIVESHESKLSLHVLNVVPEISGKGKSEALNKGYNYVKEKSEFPKTDKHLICVFDADGLPDKDLIEKMCDRFEEKEIGAINSSIRIYNRHTNFLSMMQDIEFNLIARYLNYLRGYLFRNSLMGGNGQFMRYTVLDQLYHQYGYVWKRSSLTEDLDIGMRILFMGHKTFHLPDGFVHQQGLTKLRPLIRQRNRWAWGTIQSCFKYVLSTRIFRESNVSFLSKIDLTICLLTPFVIATLIPTGLVFTVLDLSNVINITVSYSDWIFWILVSVWIIFPLFVLFMNKKEYLLFYLPSHFIGYVIYNTILIPTIIYGLLSVVLCRVPRWSKTKRIDTIIIIPQTPIVKTGKPGLKINTISPSNKKIYMITPLPTPLPTPKNNIKIEIEKLTTRPINEPIYENRDEEKRSSDTEEEVNSPIIEYDMRKESIKTPKKSENVSGFRNYLDRKNKIRLQRKSQKKESSSV